jgi:hypothetical protein
VSSESQNLFRRSFEAKALDHDDVLTAAYSEIILEGFRIASDYDFALSVFLVNASDF